MRARLSLVLFAITGCSTSSSPQKLPSARLTPHLDAAESAVACGEDLAWTGAAAPDERFAFSYDASGLLAHADGAFAAGGPDETIDYSYDASGDFTHMVDANGYGGSHSEIAATYDPTNGLTSYTWSYAAGADSESWSYAMSDFLAPWQPQHESITSGTYDVDYALAYDGDGRLVSATPSDGSAATTYTYDDQALTLTIDTGNGAFHGVVAYGSDFRELSETWGGTDPNATASTTVYAWTGDQLDTITYTQDQFVETDTFRYQCAAARAGRTARVIGPHAARSRW
jgi:YD repeat-containing protein